MPARNGDGHLDVDAAFLRLRRKIKRFQRQDISAKRNTHGRRRNPGPSVFIFEDPPSFIDAAEMSERKIARCGGEHDEYAVSSVNLLYMFCDVACTSLFRSVTGSRILCSRRAQEDAPRVRPPRQIQRKVVQSVLG